MIEYSYTEIDTTYPEEEMTIVYTINGEETLIIETEVSDYILYYKCISMG